MRDMRIGHKQIVITYFGEALILLRASMHRSELADRITVADFEPGKLGSIFFILRIFADRRKLKDAIVLANGSRPFDYYMRADDGAGIDLYVRADYRIRADRNVAGQFSAFIDDRG